METKTIAPVGVIHGRFQVLHKGHLEYLLAGKALCEHLIIGITKPDLSYDNPKSDDHREEVRYNPLTYFQRYEMIRNALISDEAAQQLPMAKEKLIQHGYSSFWNGEKIKLSDFDIVPFPIERENLLQYYVPADATFFMTIYDDKEMNGTIVSNGNCWGAQKHQRLCEKFGREKIRIMWDERSEINGEKIDGKSFEKVKPISGMMVRQHIADGSGWQHMVPTAVREYIEQNNLCKVIKDALE